MDNAIQTIVTEVQQGYIFDSHFVINELIKRFSDEYLSFASGFAGAGPNITLAVHGQIGKKIKNLNVGTIQFIGDSWSENIHKTPSKCTCWRKL